MNPLSRRQVPDLYRRKSITDSVTRESWCMVAFTDPTSFERSQIMNSVIPCALTTMPVIPPRPSRPDGRWLTQWDRRDFVELGAHDTAPGTARGVIRERLPLWGLAGFTDVAELVATELVANSVAATRDRTWDGVVPPVRVWLLGSDASVAVLVWDGVLREPVPRVAEDDDESGRGLGIVAALSERWGFYFPPPPFSGKVTWAFIARP
jgi:hypothetical protein